MKCERCQFENPEGMNFCGRCGHSLPAPCPKCGHANPAGSQSCENCHEPLPATPFSTSADISPPEYTPRFLKKEILRQQSSLQGERKIVTVLFADVAGSTRMSGRLDPEDIHDIMDRCFDILGQEIHGAGGSINQYTGDGIMALFGAPTAYADHIHRACHAALRIQDRMKAYADQVQRRYDTAFQLRIGISTGKVVVGAIGIDLRRDYTAAGETTNLAARLQTLAPPGGTFVSERVRNGAIRLFRFRRAGSFMVRGKDTPLTAYSLIGERRHIHLLRTDKGRPTPFFNRKDELSVMTHVLTSALAGASRMVAVVGEAGIGKTRLLAAFRDSIRIEKALILEARCLPYGESTVLYPITQMFRTYFELPENECLSVAKKRFRDRIGEKSLVPRLDKVCDHLSHLSDEGRTTVSFEGRKRSIFRSLRSLVSAISRIKPLILMFDDMQWADPTTRDFLFLLLRTESSGPLFIVCSGRTTEKAWCPDSPERFLHLGPLTDDASLNIFHSVLGTELLDKTISRKILDQAGGNPLFLVEMAETIRHRKLMVCDSHACTLTSEVEDLEIPETIRDVLTARLDALPGSAKRVTQLASVIGVEFSHELLKRLSRDPDRLKQHLKFLEKEGVIHKTSSDVGDKYTFHHQMMQEIAYRGLLRRNRREYHRLVGEAMERLYRDDLSNHAGFLAHHFYRSQNWPKALAYTLDAGDRARRSFSCQEALECYDRALDILQRGRWDHAREKALEIYRWKGGMHFCAGQMEKGRSTFKKMYSEAKALKDGEAEAEALFRLGWISFYMHHPRAAVDFLHKAIRQSREPSLSESLLKATSFLGFVYSVLGRLKDARPLLFKSVKLSKDVPGPEGKAWSLSYLIQYHNWTGEFDKALAMCDELRVLNETIKSPFFHIVLHFRKGLVYGALGRLDEAKHVLTEGLNHLEIGDEKFWRPRMLNTLGWVYSEGGRIEKSLELNQQSLAEALPTGDPETIHNATINVGENYLRLGDIGKAREVLEKAWKKVKGPGITYTRWRYKTRLLIALAELYEKTGERKKAISMVNKALQAARDKGARKHEARALYVKAGILSRTRPETARQYFEQALDLSVKMNARLLSEQIRGDSGIRN
jgi:class 3 adenylate cyclase/tetratricopeptide (TPR) repeat protein